VLTERNGCSTKLRGRSAKKETGRGAGYAGHSYHFRTGPSSLFDRGFRKKPGKSHDCRGRGLKVQIASRNPHSIDQKRGEKKNRGYTYWALIANLSIERQVYEKNQDRWRVRICTGGGGSVDTLNTRRTSSSRRRWDAAFDSSRRARWPELSPRQSDALCARGVTTKQSKPRSAGGESSHRSDEPLSRKRRACPPPDSLRGFLPGHQPPTAPVSFPSRSEVRIPKSSGGVVRGEYAASVDFKIRR